MQNNFIKIFLLLLVFVFVAIVVWEISARKKGRNSVNPWEYNVDEFREVKDSSIIKYSEVLNFKLDSANYRGIAYLDNRIYIVGDDFLQVISPDGKELLRKNLGGSPKCLTVHGERIFIAYPSKIESFDLNGDVIHSWNVNGDSSLITSIKVFEDLLFAADAGNRRVLRYRINGEFLGQFEGKSETGQIHGFIIPSACFDLDISADGELWVVNPGKHALEHYSHNGRMIRFWESFSFNIDGFSGCCNPVHIAILPNGSFVTSEKGIIRIKVHKPFGELYGLVAAPEKFKNSLYAPDLAVSPEGLIYALDFNTNLVRVFEELTN